MLSPDLFPLYKDDSDNSMLPIPELLEKSGLNSNDRESILELIMDVAGKRMRCLTMLNHNHK